LILHEGQFPDPTGIGLFIRTNLHLFTIGAGPFQIYGPLRGSPVKADEFKATIFIVIDDFDSPSHRICSDMKWSPVAESLHRSTKLFRFPWLNSLYGISSLERHDLPEPFSLLKIPGRTAPRFP